MNIHKVEVHGVGPLLDSKIELNPKGKNLILGPNECGKSTLCESIISIVYGFSTKKDAQQARSREEAGLFEGRVFIDIGDASYEISREFDSDDVKIVKHTANSDPKTIFDGNANPRGRTEEPQEYRKILREEIGFPPESVLCNTAYVGQLEVGITLDDDLRRQISGAGQADYKKARQIMRDQYYDLSLEPLPGDKRRRTEKKIKKLNQEIYEFEQQLELAIEGSERVNHLRMDLESKKGEYKDTSSTATEKGKDVTALEQYLGIVERYDDYQQQERLEESRKNNLRQLEDRITQIKNDLSKESYAIFGDLENGDLEKLRKYVYSDVDDTLAQIDRCINDEQRVQDLIDDDRYALLRDAPEDTGDILSRLKELKVEISDQREKIRGQDNTVERKARNVLWLVPLGLFIVGGVIGGLLGNLFIGFSELSINPVLGIIIGSGMLGIALGFIGFIIALSLRSQPVEGKLDVLAAETRLADARSERDEIAEEMKPIFKEEKSLDVLIERWENLKRLQEEKDDYIKKRELLEDRDILNTRENPQLKSVIESETTAVLKDRLKIYDDLLSEMQTKQETLKGLSTEQEDASEDISSKLKEEQRKMESLEEKFPTFKEYRGNLSQGTERLEKGKRELERLDDRSSDLSNQVRQAELDLVGYHSPTSDNPDVIEEQLEQKREELERCVLHKDALAIAIETLDKAIMDYEEKHLLRLSSKTSQYFKLFTKDHYSEISIDADQIRVSDNQGLTFDVINLSSGAKDQLFLALRIAITDLLSTDMPVPIIMDDSFVNFDPVRLTAALEFMSQMGLERQVILLSHDENYKMWADKVIMLDDC